MQSTAHGIRRNEERAEEADGDRDDGKDGQAGHDAVEGFRAQDRDAENHQQDDDADCGSAWGILEPVLRVSEGAAGEGHAEQDGGELDVVCSNDNFKADNGQCRSNQGPAFNPAQEWADDTGGENVVTATARHSGGETGEDHAQKVTKDTGENGHPRESRDAQSLPFWTKRVEGHSPAYRRANKGGDVEEECVRHADIAHEARRLPNE